MLPPEPATSPASPTIDVRDVVKCYHLGGAAVRAVDRISLHVPAGEFVSVMGPSGSGKSTLLHLIGGLDVPDAGEIRIGPHHLSQLSDDEVTLLRRRTVGFVFQFFNLLPTLTVAENVALPRLLDGARMRDLATRVGELLARVGLSHRAGHRPDQLSGGEMQRVGIARALVAEPLVLLADEPTGNLDSNTGEEILRLLRRLRDDFGTTIVMVTHDRRAASYGNRIVTLRDGRIESDVRTTDAPDAVSTAPEC
jgi:putative ABC transport system ATP-binding protein